MNLSNPILVYSNYCTYSKQFLTTIMKSKKLYDSIAKLNIDSDPITRMRPKIFFELQKQINTKIDRVPTIIVKIKETVYVLSDVEAFKWLDYHITNDTNFENYNKNEMDSFSDMYASFNLNDNTPKPQNYKFFINKELLNDCIFKDGIIPEDTEESKISLEQKEQERNNIHMPVKPKELPVMTSKQFSDNKTESKLTFDARLEQLMKERGK